MSTKTGDRAIKAQRTQLSSSAPESARQALLSYADDAAAVSNNSSGDNALGDPEPASEMTENEPEQMRALFGHRVAAMTAGQVKSDVDQALAEQAAAYEQSVEAMKASVAEFKAEVKDEIEELQAAVDTIVQSLSEDMKSLNEQSVEENKAANAEFLAEIKADIARHQATTIEGVRTERRELFADTGGVRSEHHRSLRSPTLSSSWSPTRPSSPPAQTPLPQFDTGQPVHPHLREPADTPMQSKDHERPTQQIRQPPSQFNQQHAELIQNYQQLYQLACQQQQRIDELVGQYQLAPVPLARPPMQPGPPVPLVQYPHQELLPSGQPPSTHVPDYQDFLGYQRVLDYSRPPRPTQARPVQQRHPQQPYQPDSAPPNPRKRRAP